MPRDVMDLLSKLPSMVGNDKCLQKTLDLLDATGFAGLYFIYYTIM